LDILVRGRVGESYLLLGNEAVARGVLEGGVSVATTYPGTPSSEIADAIALMAREAGIYMEYSTNEMVALEVAAGVSISGARAICSMKMVGLNVASDALMTLAYTGVRGGLVVVSADDPDCFSSQNEQDNRYYSLLGNVPCLEPSNPQEAKDMLLSALRLSEEFELPVMLRLVTRVSHARKPVVLGPVEASRRDMKFSRDVKRFVMVPSNARPRHLVLLEKMDRVKRVAEESSLNAVLGEGALGVVTSGVSFNYCMEALNLLDLKASVLKLGFANPLPTKLITSFLKEHDPVVVVEELEPFLELQIRSMAQGAAVHHRILGKLSDPSYLPRNGELSTKLVLSAICKILDRPTPVDFQDIDDRSRMAEVLSPPRPPVLCPGCPHMASFHAIKVATGGKAVCATDIGCYALGAQPPLSVGDVMLCMGASAGVSSGISKIVGEPVIGVVGDSTFFHASIPGLINAVYNKHRFVYVVLDNCTTAMTNFQPHPGTGVTGLGESSKPILIEDVAKGCGVDFVRVTDPYDLKCTISTIKEAVEYNGPAIVISRHKCAILESQERTARGEDTVPFEIDEEKCTECMACIKLLACPALVVSRGNVSIDSILCMGCGVCAQVCPYVAIRRS
jgi:indolepyruvate ferredoxin oxidoreductase alpha subunit